MLFTDMVGWKNWGFVYVYIHAGGHVQGRANQAEWANSELERGDGG